MTYSRPESFNRGSKSWLHWCLNSSNLKRFGLSSKYPFGRFTLTNCQKIGGRASTVQDLAVLPQSLFLHYATFSSNRAISLLNLGHDEFYNALSTFSAHPGAGTNCTGATNFRAVHFYWTI